MVRTLFLTSAGLPKETRNFFLKLFDKDPKDIKVAFIPTAADPEDDKWFVDLAKKELATLNFSVSEVDLKEDKDTIRKKLNEADVIYINGGNTFYLLDWVRKSGLDKYLGEILDQGKVYIGASAGSALVGPNIEAAGWGPNGDENIVNLKDLTGLNLVPFLVYPHYTEDEREVIEKNMKSINYQVIPITDKQALLVKGQEWELVGEDRYTSG